VDCAFSSIVFGRNQSYLKVAANEQRNYFVFQYYIFVKSGAYSYSNRRDSKLQLMALLYDWTLEPAYETKSLCALNRLCASRASILNCREDCSAECNLLSMVL
jgi:hypothetical protein